MNRYLLGAAAVLLAGIATLAVGFLAPSDAPAADPAAGASAGPALVPASRALAPVVPGTTWDTDPFTMNRLGERHGASLPFPPPPSVTLPPLPTMPFPPALASPTPAKTP